MRLSTVMLLALAVTGPAAGGQKTLQLKDLPAAVQAAVRQEEAKGATIRNIAAEKASGKTVYEVETMVAGHTRNLIIDAAGKVVEAEEEVSIDAVPTPVRATLVAAGKVLKVERLTKGETTTYEAQVETNGKKSEVTVDAAGKRVKH